MKAKNHKTWTDKETKLLQECLDKEMTCPEIADLLNRTARSVQAYVNRKKLRKIGSGNDGRTVENVRMLYASIFLSWPLTTVSRLLQQSRGIDIQAKIQQLSLRELPASLTVMQQSATRRQPVGWDIDDEPEQTELLPRDREFSAAWLRAATKRA